MSYSLFNLKFFGHYLLPDVSRLSETLVVISVNRHYFPLPGTFLKVSGIVSFTIKNREKEISCNSLFIHNNYNIFYKRAPMILLILDFFYEPGKISNQLIPGYLEVNFQQYLDDSICIMIILCGYKIDRIRLYRFTLK